MTGTKLDADNEGCNDNYDDIYGNFDDIMPERKRFFPVDVFP